MDRARLIGLDYAGDLSRRYRDIDERARSVRNDTRDAIAGRSSDPASRNYPLDT